MQNIYANLHKIITSKISEKFSWLILHNLQGTKNGSDTLLSAEHDHFGKKEGFAHFIIMICSFECN